MEIHDIRLSIPMPLQVIVDDVGWWSGKDGSQNNQPFRTGMSRDHVPGDYTALIELGKKLNAKILAGFVLCEWDKFNILKNLTSSQWMGTEWSMAGIREDEKERAAWIIKHGMDHIEIGLHGVGHEFWIEKKMHRAEFHDEHCVMREPDIVKNHLDYFFRLMDQHGFSPRPSCFIPPAMKYSFGNGDKGFQKLLKEAGISYVTTNFQKARQFSKPFHPKITWESGVMIVDRGKAISAWNDIASDPAFFFDGPILTLHWPNILHHLPEKNLEVVDRWVRFIKTGSEKHGFILSRNIRECFTQYAYKMFSRIKSTHNGYVVDLSWKKNFPGHLLSGSLLLNITKSRGMAIQIIGAEPTFLPENQTSLLLKITPLKEVEKIVLLVKRL